MTFDLAWLDFLKPFAIPAAFGAAILAIIGIFTYTHYHARLDRGDVFASSTPTWACWSGAAVLVIASMAILGLT